MEFRFIYICDFFIYIFSAALGLCCAQTVSSCSAVSGTALYLRCMGFSYCAAWALVSPAQ